MATSDPELDGHARADAINDLDCVICGRWFRNFDRLATHMYARHGRPTPNQPGDVELPPVPRTRPAFVPVQPNTKGTPDMAKRKRANAPGGKLPPPKDSSGADELNPFLKAEHIGGLGDAATLVLTGENRLADSQYGEQIICEVRHGAETFDWGIGLASPNYRMLFEKFGDDVKDWRGKVNVVIKQGARSPFVAVARSRR